VGIDTEEANLLARRLDVEGEVYFANALTNDVLNDGNTIKIASLNIVVNSVAS
jgi:hypothetical protein